MNILHSQCRLLLIFLASKLCVCVILNTTSVTEGSTGCMVFQFPLELDLGSAIKPMYNNITIFYVMSSGTVILIHDSYKTRLNYNGDFSKKRISFCLQNITVNDTGNYDITIGLLTYTNVLQVSVELTYVRLDPSQDFELYESETKALVCVARSIPLANITWNINGSVWSNSTKDTVTSYLAFTGNRYDHNKYLYCTAKTGNTTVFSSKVKLSIIYAPKMNPTVEVSPEGGIIAGNNVTLNCSTWGGNPLPFLKWNCTSGLEQNNTAGNQSLYSVTFPVNKADNNKICGCSASHPIATYRPVVYYRLVVFYAPDYITVEQNPVFVVDQQNITLTCYATGGNPLAILSWNCSGITRSNTTGNTASNSVEFIASKTDNDKVCICSASHNITSYILTQQHRLTVFYAPETAPRVQQTPVGPIITGSKVNLTCTVLGGNPLATLTWNCTGTTSNNTSGDTASYSVEMTVDNTYNGRICTCSGTHPVTSYRPSEYHSLVVYYPPGTSPSIQQNQAGAIITGYNVTLTCTVSGGNPLAILSWNCTGTTSNNTSEDTASYSVELTVNNTYNGRICTCSGTHPVTSYRPNVQHRLVVYYAPKTDPSVKQTPTGAIITGYNVTLTCTVSGGNPLAILSWNCTGTTSNNTSEDTASYSVELTVNNTYNGRICTCSGTHPVTSYRPTVHHTVVVIYGPSEVRISPATPSYTLKETEGSVGPINCLADCNPACVITWFGPHLSADMTTLYLQGINKSQAGNYQCAASNALSSVLSAIVEIVVEWGPILNEGVLSSPQKISLSIGMMLNLTISVTANPVPSIQWGFQYNSLIKNITEISNSSTNGFQHKSSVIISTIDATHFGTYTVIISNSIGYLNRTFSVIERDKPTFPKFVHAICKTMAATILWQSSYNGGSEQHFKVQFWKSGESTHTTLEQNISDPGFEFFHQYTVDHLSADTHYWFTVLAINEIGFSFSKTVNCTTDTGQCTASSQERSEFFVAAVSALILTIIIVVVFTICCYLYRKRTTIKRSDNYVDLTTNHGSDDAYTYTTIQETDMGTQNMNKEQYARDKQTHEECQLNLKANDVNTYHNNIQIKPPKKDVVYANMTV